MVPALYRDKDGRVVHAFPFILVIDPILNRGHIFPDAEAVDDAWADDDLLDGATPATILPMLAARGYRIHFLRSEADLEDELLGYFAIADGQLQEAISSLWVQQDFEFAGSAHVDWNRTTTMLYTDGERLMCEGHTIALTLPLDHPERSDVERRVRTWLESFAEQVAQTLRCELRYVGAARR